MSMYRKWPLAVRLTLIYALTGALWILLSDRAVGSLFQNAAQLSRVQTYKGWLFVLTTALLLYLYITREAQNRKKLEHDLGNLFEHAVEGIFQATPQGRYLKANPALARLYGYASPQALLSSAISIDRPLDPEARTQLAELLARGEDLEGFEARAYRQDGGLIWISINARLVRDRDGNPLYLEGFVTDITARKLAESALKESEEQYRRLVEHSPYAMAVHCRGMLVYVNEAGVRLIGAQNVQELIGLPVIDFVHPRSRPLVLQRFKELSQGKAVPPLEETFIRRDGSLVQVEVRAYPFLFQGEPAVQVVMRDLTPQKEAQEALRASEERFRRAFHASPLPICITTLAEGRFVDANQAYLRLIQGQREDLIGRTALELNFYNSAEEREEFLRQLRGPRPLQGVEEKFVTLKGDVRDVLAFYEEIELDGKACILSMFYDITEHKRATRQLERQLAHLTLLHNIALAASQSYSEDEVIERATRLVDRMFSPANCGVLLLNDAGNALQPHPSYLGLESGKAREELPLSQGVSGEAARSGRPVRIGDVSRAAPYIEIAPEVRSELCVPIRVNQKVIGVFNIESAVADAFDEDDERLLNTIAGSLGTAIERIRLLQIETKQRQEAEHLREATLRLTSSLEPERLYQNILDALHMLVPYDSASIQLAREAGVFEIVAVRGLPEEAHLLGTAFHGLTEKWGRAIQQGKPIIIADAQQDERFEPLKGTEHIRGWMRVPLHVQEALIGFLNLDSRTVGYYNESHANLAQTFANQAAIAIQNAMLFKSAQQRYQEAEKLRRAAMVAASSLKLQEVLNLLLEELKEVVPYDSASIFLPEGEQVRIVAALGLPNRERAINRTFPAGNKLLQQILQSGRPLIIEDVRNDARFEQWVAAPDIRGWMGVPMIARGRIIGFITLDSLAVGAYDANTAALAQSFAHQAAIALENAQLYESLQKSNIELSQAYDVTLEGWGKALELRDRETQGHTRRVLELTLELARRMGCNEEQLVHIRRGVLVHDIGKMGVPDRILHKRGRLTPKELAEMRRHTQFAHELLYPIAYLRPALDIPYSHHEWWDGSGYPLGLKGEEIPFSARLFAVVDVWDALLFDRVYRKAWPKKRAMQYIREMAGRQFDPRIAEAFLKMIEEGEAGAGRATLTS